MMSWYFILIISLVLAIFLFLIYRKLQDISGEKKDDQSLLMIQNQINEIRKTLDIKIGESTQLMQNQFKESIEIIRDVTEKLTKLDETNRQVMSFADQLQNLQNILRNPKQRGVLGEYYLETVLKNVLPPQNYKMQYKIGKDEEGRDLIVDAVVFVKDKIIPIDSKFSLENYNRILEERDEAEKERLEKLFKQDLKTRIDETSKYIMPDKGTMDFAFMFIPSEAIFYDLLINQVGTVKIKTRDLIEYAFKEKHVIIVSPTSFLAYLQTVLQGLRALQMEESMKEIIKNLGKLNKHLLSYDTYMKKLGNNIGVVVNVYNQAYKEFKKVDKDMAQIIGSKSRVEPLQIEKPLDE